LIDTVGVAYNVANGKMFLSGSDVYVAGMIWGHNALSAGDRTAAYDFCAGYY
jgi:hypothetical protein